MGPSVSSVALIILLFAPRLQGELHPVHQHHTDFGSEAAVSWCWWQRPITVQVIWCSFNVLHGCLFVFWGEWGVWPLQETACVCCVSAAVHRASGHCSSPASLSGGWPNPLSCWSPCSGFTTWSLCFSVSPSQKTIEYSLTWPSDPFRFYMVHLSSYKIYWFQRWITPDLNTLSFLSIFRVWLSLFYTVS